MAAGDEVGRAFIEIIPEIDRFIRQLRNDLRRVLKAVEGNVKSTAGQMERDFDDAGRNIRSSMDRTGRSIKESFEDGRKALVDEMTRGGAEGGRRLRVSFEDQLKRIASSVKSVRAPIVGEFRRVGDEMGGALLKEWRRHVGQVHRDVERAARDSERSWQRYLANARRASDVFEKSQVAAHLRTFRETIRIHERAQRQLERLARNTGRKMGDNIVGGVRSSFGAGRIGGLISGFFQEFVFGQHIRLFISRIRSNLIVGLAGLAAAAVQAIVGVVGPALQALAGSLAFLPGVIAGVVASFLVLKAATSGVGAALEFAMKGKVDQLRETLAKLAPEARSFVLEINNIAKALKPMQLALQNAFFAGTGTQIALIGRMLSQLEPFVTALGQALNGIFIDVLRFGRSLQALSAARSVLQGLRDFFVALRPAVTPLLEALANLARQAGAFGGQLGKALADLIIKFSNFLNTIDLVEVFNNIKTAIQTLLPFFRVLAVIFDVLNQVATAFRPVLDAVGKALGALGTILADMAIAMAPGLAALIRGIAEGFTALIPVAAPVGRAIGAIARAMAPIAETLGHALANVLLVIATVIEGVLTVLQPFIDLWAEAVQQWLSQLLPVLMKLAAMAMPLLADAAQKIFNAMIPIIPVIARMAQQFFTLLLPALLKLGMTFLNNVLPHMIKFAQELGPIMIRFLEDLEPHIPALVQALVLMAAAYIKLITAAAPLLPLLAKFIAVMARVTIAIINGVVRAARLLGAGLRALISPFGVVRSATNSTRTTLLNLGAAFARLYNTARSWIGRLVSAVRGLAGSVRGAVSGAGSWLYQAGRNIIQGLINGIRSMIGALRSTISSVASTVRNFLPFSPAKVGPLSGRGNPELAGQRITAMIAEGIRKRLRDVRTAVAESLNVAAPLAEPALDVTTLNRLVAPTRTDVGGIEASSTLDLDELTRAVAQTVGKSLDGLEWRMVDVDKVVARWLGKRVNLAGRGG